MTIAARRAAGVGMGDGSCEDAWDAFFSEGMAERSRNGRRKASRRKSCITSGGFFVIIFIENQHVSRG